MSRPPSVERRTSSLALLRRWLAPRRSSARHPWRLQVELLEERQVPTIFNVNSLADFAITPATVNAQGQITNQPGNPVTLRSAIEAANVTAGGNTINLTIAGTYKITLTGANEDANLTGDFDLLPVGDLTIQNTSGGTALVDGNHLDRVFDVNPLNTNNAPTHFTFTFLGFTIENGLAQPGDLAGGSGGGIRDQGNESLTLTDMVLTHNAA